MIVIILEQQSGGAYSNRSKQRSSFMNEGVNLRIIQWSLYSYCLLLCGGSGGEKNKST